MADLTFDYDSDELDFNDDSSDFESSGSGRSEPIGNIKRRIEDYFERQELESLDDWFEDM